MKYDSIPIAFGATMLTNPVEKQIKIKVKRTQVKYWSGGENFNSSYIHTRAEEEEQVY